MDRRHTRAGIEVDLDGLRDSDVQILFEVFSEVVAAGEGFPHSAPLSREGFEATWRGPGTTVIAARVDGALAGAYYLRPNFPGRAAHIANAGYVVAGRWRRQGIGRVLIEDSISRAPSLGFDAIQFNLVFASNPARALYEELGWREIGRVPDAVEGDPAIIYWRRTTEQVESRAAAEQESQRAGSASTRRSVARSGERGGEVTARQAIAEEDRRASRPRSDNTIHELTRRSPHRHRQACDRLPESVDGNACLPEWRRRRSGTCRPGVA